jgi:hypothetical protein
MINASSSADRQGRGRTLFALGFGFFIDRGEEQTMSVLSPILEDIWLLSKSQLGLITTVRTVVQTVSAPFWGYAAFADIIHYKTSIGKREGNFNSFG